jgi:hypothetical protein
LSHQTYTWTGVICTGGRITALHLAGDGLRGSFPAGVLGGLTRLTVLSPCYNALSGPLPAAVPAH